MSITVTPVNDPPSAVDDSPSTVEDTLVTIDVAANDTDPDGNLDPSSAHITCATCSDVAKGTLVNNGNGTFGYTPAPDINGNDGFVYEICDDLGACDTATVDITIDPVADPPVAADDTGSTVAETPVTIDVAANDTDADGDLDPSTANTGCAGCSGPANGDLANNGDGSFAYTPVLVSQAVTYFVYEICDRAGTSM